MITMTERAEVNQLLGIDSRVVDADEIGRLCPELNLSSDVTWPIMGALYHPPGGIIRHDAVVWGFARGADRRGVEIHPDTEVTGHRARERPRHGRPDEPRRHRGCDTVDQRDRRLVDAGRRPRRRRRCRSRRTSSRRS